VTGFIARRLAGSVLTLWAAMTAAYFLVRAIPGDPFITEKAVSPAVTAAMKEKYGYTGDKLGDYGRWLKHIVTRGDFGPCIKYRNWSVGELLALGFPVSAFLGFLALTLATGVGVTAGAVAAARRNTALDYATIGGVIVGICLPSFVIAPALMMVFAFWLRLAPAAGWESVRHAILPVVCLSLPYIAYISRLTRSGVIEAMGKDYVRTARAKGLAEGKVIFEHALRNGIIPVVTFLGPAAAGLMTGSFVIEFVFDVPGMGKYFVNAFQNRDYNLMLGDITVFIGLIVLFNFLVDLSYGLIDPRVRVS
jgi:oligopeptide transport system permease protein